MKGDGARLQMDLRVQLLDIGGNVKNIIVLAPVRIVVQAGSIIVVVLVGMNQILIVAAVMIALLITQFVQVVVAFVQAIWFGIRVPSSVY